MSVAEHKQRMSRVIRWIEENIDNDLDVDKLSSIACYSKFHFHRVFRAYTGENAIAFRRRLLLERAAHQLVYSRLTITQIAFASGYDSQPSFNKAFRQQFAHSPSEFRKNKLSINSAQKSVNIEEIFSMKPEIKEIPSLSLICVRKQGSYSDATAEAWGALMNFAYSRKLMRKDTKMIGIPHDDPDVTAPDHIRYDACITVDSPIDVSGEVQQSSIKKGKYAVFLHKGSYEDFAKTYSYIFKQWLPESEMNLRDLPCFEIYLNRDPRRTKPENLRTEIYLPIK